MMTQKKDYCVSYAPKDAPWAHWVCALLSSAGLTSLQRPYDGTHSLVAEAYLAAQDAHSVLALMSGAYMNLFPPANEWKPAVSSNALSLTSLVTAVRIGEAIPSALGSEIPHIDLHDLRDPERAAQALLGGLGEDLQGPIAVPRHYPGKTPVNNLPGKPERFFGREAELEKLSGLISHGQARIAITGLAGTGKSALAREAARRAAPFSSLVWILDASSPIGLQSSVQSLVDCLPIAPSGETGSWHSLRQWLGSQSAWLLLFDGLEDYSLLDSDVVESFLPKAHSGNVIFTSRAYPETKAVNFPLEGLATDDAMELYRACSGQARDDAARELAERLDGLPAAILAAGEYAKAAGVSASEIRELLGDFGLAIFEYAQAGAMPFLADWRETLRAVRSENLASWQLLSIASWMGAAPIPLSFIEAIPQALPQPLQAQLSGADLGKDGVLIPLTCRCAASLKGDAIRVSPLVSETAREMNGPDRQALKCAMEISSGCLASLGDGTLAGELEAGRLLVHLQSVADHAYRLFRDDAATMVAVAKIYAAIGAACSASCQAQKALGFLERARALGDEFLAQTDPQIATVYKNMAGAYRLAGSYEAALDWFARLIAVRLKSRQPDLVAIAADYDDIAQLCMETGDFTSASLAWDKALSYRKEIPADVSDILQNTENLAGAWMAAGEENLSLMTYKEALSRALESGRYDRMASLCHVLSLLSRQVQDYSQALQFALMRLEYMLSPSDMEMSSAYDDIAIAYTGLGNSEKALEYCEKSIGLAHGNADVDEESLVSTLMETARRMPLERIEEASQLYSDVMKIALDSFGENSLISAGVLEELALFSQKNMEHIKALEYYQKALAIRLRAGTLEDERVANDSHQVGACFEACEDFGLALEWYEKAYSIRERLYGENGVDLADDCLSIARALNRGGDEVSALYWYQRAYTIFSKDPNFNASGFEEARAGARTRSKRDEGGKTDLSSN